MRKILAVLILLGSHLDAQSIYSTGGSGGGTPTYPLAAPAADNCATPPYSFTSDTDTGICSSIAGTVDIRNDGVSGFKFASGGRASSTIAPNADGTSVLTFTNTIPTSGTGHMESISITSTGSAWGNTSTVAGLRSTLLAGYTGNRSTFGILGDNSVGGGSATILITGFGGTGPATGVVGVADDSGSSLGRVGVYGLAAASGSNSARSYGVVGNATSSTGSNEKVGVYGSAINIGAGTENGVIASLGAIGTIASAALLVDNIAEASPIAIFRDAGTDKFTIADGGLVTAAEFIQSQAGDQFLTANATNATTTFSNLTDLTVTVTTGRKYNFEMTLFVDNSTDTDGIKLDFEGGTATATDFRAHTLIHGSAALLLTTQVTALATDISLASLVGVGQVKVSGSFEPSGTGTFIPRFATVTAVSGTLTVFRGSNLIVKDMP